MKNLTGQRFGKLTAISPTLKRSNGEVFWLCVCECGQKTEVRSGRLLSGTTRSCWCLRKRNAVVHGHGSSNHRSRTYQSYISMKIRCLNKNSINYKHYGGRGINICEDWLNKKHGFEHFLRDVGERLPGMTIDRIDNNKGYYKENCRWTDAKTQRKNQRKSVGK